MKRIFISLFTGLLLVVFASRDSHAEMHSPIGDPEMGCQEEGIPMTPPIRPPIRDGMAGIPDIDHLMWEYLMCLGLDEKQREELREIKSRAMKETIRKRADGCIAGIELKDLLDKDPVNIKAVEAKLKQIEALKTETHLSLIRAKEEVKSKLTPEQRKKFREMLEKEPGMGPPMMGRMMPGSMSIIPPPPYYKREGTQPAMVYMPHKER